MPSSSHWISRERDVCGRSMRIARTFADQGPESTATSRYAFLICWAPLGPESQGLNTVATRFRGSRPASGFHLPGPIHGAGNF